MGLRNLIKQPQPGFSNQQAQDLWQQNVPQPQPDYLNASANEFAQPGQTNTAPVVINNNPPMISETQRVETKKAQTGYEKKIEKSFEEQIKAQSKIEELKAQNANAEIEHYDNISKQNMYANAEMEIKQEEYNNKRLGLEDKLAQARQDYSDAKIDPNRWKDADSGRRVMSAIAIGLGAFSGNKNYALEIINQSIQRDIDAQVSEMNKKKENVILADNDFARLKQTFGDEAQAMNALKVMKYETIISQVNALAANTKSPLILANRDKTVAELNVEKNKVMGNLVNAPTTQTTTLSKPLIQSPEDKRANDRLWTPVGQATNETSANKVKDSISNYNSAKQNIDEVKQAINKYGVAELVTGAGKGKLNAAIDAMVEVIRLKSNMGVLNPGERENIVRSLPLNQVLRGAVTSKEEINSYIDQTLRQLEVNHGQTLKANIPTLAEQQNKPQFGKPR